MHFIIDIFNHGSFNVTQKDYDLFWPIKKKLFITIRLYYI